MLETANKYIHKNTASFSYAAFTSLYFDKFKSMGYNYEFLFIQNG